jgi:hypothetical protein
MINPERETVTIVTTAPRWSPPISPGLDDRLGQPAKQPVRANQTRPLRLQLLDELFI